MIQSFLLSQNVFHIYFKKDLLSYLDTIYHVSGGHFHAFRKLNKFEL